MKKKLLLSLVLFSAYKPILIRAKSNCVTTASCACDCNTNSHSFFCIKPVYQIVSPEYLVHNRTFYKDYNKSCGASFQAAMLGGKSTHNDGIARFFLPVCKTILNVNEQPLDDTDVLASYLNIYTNNGDFQSTVEFKPKHSYVGVGLNFQKRFYETCNGNGFWFSISGPVLSVRNRIDLVETVINDGGGAIRVSALAPVTGSCPEVCPNSCNSECILDPAQALAPVGSVIQAFGQPGWCFGRIDNNSCQKNDKTRIGDITLRLGYEIVNDSCFHLDTFGGVIAPTGNKPTAVTVFEPMIGHNSHWGVTLGSNMGFQAWCCNDFVVYGAFDFTITQLFSKIEKRSFDLKNKPWSRYMQFYKNEAQAVLAATSADPLYALTLHTPGIDILTQDLQVKPGYYRAFNGALIVDRNCFELELGYNFFARQAECVRLDCAFPEGVALKAINLGEGATGRFQTINNDFGNNCLGSSIADYADNIITPADLNLESAAHPAILSHTIYASLAYKFETCNGYPLFIAAGASYEFPPDNAGLNRWMTWGKLGIAF